MIVIVTGSRDYTNKDFVFDKLDKLHSYYRVDMLICGDANGIDYLSSLWAKERQIPYKKFEANWDLFGKKAGPIRNEKMAKHGADVCVAFPGGRGTENMKSIAKKYNITVLDIIE